MGDRYRLGRLGNGELLAALSRLAQQDNELAADWLAHLAELEERKLFLELGYPSLFAYCTEALGLCRSSAYRRIAAARVGRQFPEVFERVASGELSVSALSEISPHVDSENAAELFEACSGRSCRQVEEWLAARFPRPDVKDQIRRLQPLSADRFGVHFTADTEFRDLLEEVRDLARYRHPQGDLLSLMRAGLEAYRRELQKSRFGVGKKARAEKPRDSVPALGLETGNEPRNGSAKRRYVPAAVTREVYMRDGKRCSFVSQDGRRCGARAWLERDHVDPVAAGGGSSVENIRMRCRAHNQQTAREHFGSAYMRAVEARARRERTSSERRQ